MGLVMISSNITMVVVLVVSMLVQTTSADPLSTILPPSLTISKVQEAIQSASLEQANMISSPKLDVFLEYLKEISPTNTPADRSDTSVRKNSGLDRVIHINKNNEVIVDVLGQTSPGKTLESVLTEKGYSVINCFMNQCSTYLRIDQIEGITKLAEVFKINLAQPTLHRQPPKNRHRVLRKSKGRDLQLSVQSQAVRAMFVDTARSRYNNINGTGITIGILSDSFDCQRNGNRAQADVLSGDLPSLSRINVLADYFEEDCTDEGRAMMQLVYDIAPGANFAFHTAFRGEADFAAGIRALADAGCQIIVDHVVYLNEPFFQDGIIALAVNDVVSRGVSYFSSAGNFANIAWDGTSGFTSSGVNAYNGTLHSYGLDANGSHVVLQPFRTRKRSTDLVFLLQWDEPYISPTGNGGSRSDVDIYVLDDSGNILSTQPFYNTGFDPYEYVFFNTVNVTTAENATTVDVYVAIVLYEGPPPTNMKIISLDSGRFNFSAGTEATCFGHRNSASAAGVGAAYYINTPAYGVSPPVIEPFSSYGGIPILFDADSNRLPIPEIRQQPRFTGPDGVSTTFFSFPDRTFFGTSASASNVAAVAALMMQLQAKSTTKITPAKLFQILESTAIDMTSTVGFDFITGYGYVNASSALDALSALIVTKAPTNSPTDSPTKSPTAAPVSSPTKCGLFGLNFFCPARSECGFFRRLFKVNGC